MSEPLEPISKKHKIIGGNLRYLRLAAGLSQQKIARVLGVTYQQVQKYEIGQNRLSIEKLHQLKHFYNVPYDIFFRGMTETDLVEPIFHEEMIYMKLLNLRNRDLKRKIEHIIHILIS